MIFLLFPEQTDLNMVTNITSQELIDFEIDIGNCFNNKMIRAPIHLYHGNEDKMLKIFEKVKEDDWVCCSWRSHYQCLLKGVPKELLKDRILLGKSIALCFKDYKIVSSAIVGGIIPISVGIAWGEKLKNTGNKVWCFVGDMTSATGIYDEARRYSLAHKLPLVWVIEDNEKSVCTPTESTWGKFYPAYKNRSVGVDYIDTEDNESVIYYKYNNAKYPHAGAGIRVQF